MVIQLEQIGRIYRKGRVDVVALRKIDLSIAEGEFVAIMGPSGSGKSTLLHILGCLDCPSEGRYLLDGVDATTLDDSPLSALRNQKIGFIFQSFYLLPQQTVLQNIETPILYGQPAAETRVAYQRHARQLAEQVGLGQRLHHRPSELSGGEVQRVAIARALVVAPRVILADEPTGNLDSRTGQEIMALLSGLHAQGHTILLVTHEPHVAEYADRIIFLKDGEIERDTAREEQKSRRTENGKRKAEQQNSRTAETPMAEDGKQKAGEQNSRRAEKPSGLLVLPSAFRLLPAAFDTAIHGVLLHKFRSLLSVLGIVFGIGAIIAMLAIGSGAKQEILEQIALLGMTNITVTAIPPSEDVITTSNEQLSLGLTTSDAERLRQGSPYITSLAAVRRMSAPIQYHNRLLQAQLVGTTAEYVTTANLRLQQGRFLTTADERELQRVCVLGAEVRQTLFAFKNPIGELVKIRHDWYRVVGTLANKDLDSEKFPAIQLHNVNLDVYIPLSTSGMFVPPAESQRIQEISIRVTASERVDAVAQVIRTILTRVHHGARDYDVMVPRELLQQHQQTQQVFNLVMGCIAGISLLVGGIGIMNIMLATVTERTKEIGIRRAIGASRQMILLQFLFETLLLTCIGGMLGILLGSGGAAVISLFAQWRTVIDIKIIGLAVGISTAIGIIFGLFPAIQGANMDPIAALRYE